jgi:hypothetical protein
MNVGVGFVVIKKETTSLLCEQQVRFGVMDRMTWYQGLP